MTGKSSEEAASSASALLEFRRGWPAVACCCLGAALGVLPSIPALPIFMGALSAEFGWSRSQIGLAATFNTIGLCLSLPLLGRACDRLGTRRVIPIAILGLALGLLMATQIRDRIWTLYTSYFLIGSLGAGTSYVAYARVVSSWFSRSRGLALSGLMAGPALASLTIPLLLPPLIDAVGWRNGYLVTAALALLPLPLMLLFVREGRVAIPAQDASPVGVGLRQAMRMPPFWLLLCGVFFIGLCLLGLNIHLPGILIEAGAGDASAIRTLSLFGAGSLTGRLMTGALLDRFSPPVIVALLFSAPAAGIALFMLVGLPAGALMAFTIGLSLGAEGDALGYLVGRYFGLRSYSEIFGWLFNGMVVAGALSPVMIGGLHGFFGSYSSTLAASAAVCLIAASLFAGLLICKPPAYFHGHPR